MSDSVWLFFYLIFACKWRPNLLFLAFHEVKCGSEHFKNQCLHILPQFFYLCCTKYAQFFGHSLTNFFSYDIVPIVYFFFWLFLAFSIFIFFLRGDFFAG